MRSAFPRPPRSIRSTMVSAFGEAGEESLEDVEDKQFLGAAFLAASSAPEFEICSTAGILTGDRAHAASIASMAARVGPSTSSWRARESSCPGRASGRCR